MVSTTRGFLLRMDPIVTLPPEFDILESLLQRVLVKTASGEPGPLPSTNSARQFIKGEPYGLARQVLPAQISHPIPRCAEICGFKLFMEYAGSYALFDYRLVDPAAAMDYSNLGLIRAFENGLGPTSSEANFVLVHVDMVQNEVPMPDTPLKEILHDFREYRPSNRKSFLQNVGGALSRAGPEELRFGSSLPRPCCHRPSRVRPGTWISKSLAPGPQSSERLSLATLVLRATVHSQTGIPSHGQGGSPIVAWLPNQLGAVLDEMVAVYEGSKSSDGRPLGRVREDIMEAGAEEEGDVEEGSGQVLC
ncbi:hypothetical protein ACJ41O_005227 [Fusarium nematophilum]